MVWLVDLADGFGCYGWFGWWICLVDGQFDGFGRFGWWTWLMVDLVNGFGSLIRLMDLIYLFDGFG